MIKFLKSIFGEWTLFLALLGLTLLLPTITHWIDPTAGVLDPAFVQLLFYGMLKVIASLLLLWVVIHIGFKSLARYVDSERWGVDFDNLAPAERVKIATTIILTIFVVVAGGIFFAV